MPLEAPLGYQALCEAQSCRLCFGGTARDANLQVDSHCEVHLYTNPEVGYGGKVRPLEVVNPLRLNHLENIQHTVDGSEIPNNHRLDV